LHGAAQPAPADAAHDLVLAPGTKWQSRLVKSEVDPPAPHPAAEAKLATYREVQAWKAMHGLTLSAGGISTALIAAAAPLLTSPAIDLTKAFVLPG
jgi:hypothetical protein